jgi:Glycosyl hydrolase family 12
VTKLRFAVFSLAVALVVVIASSALLNSGPLGLHGSARHQLPLAGPGRPDIRSAIVSQALSGAAADMAQAADGWSTVRTMFAARLVAAQRAAAARRSSRPRTVRLCHQFQHVAAFGEHGAGLVVRNDSYGGRRECLANVNRWANFAVASSTPHRAGREPVAFPDIFYGCSWGVCSPGTQLPRRVSRLQNPVTSWYTAGHPSGRWDAAYDIWFARRRSTDGQDHGAEVMLWLRTRGLGQPAGKGILIDHRRWQLEHWITTNPASGERWPLIIFRMVRSRGYVKRLALMPFFHRVEAMGLLHRSYWLTAVEAGFEVWKGGAGLRTTSFWVRP